MLSTAANSRALIILDQKQGLLLFSLIGQSKNSEQIGLICQIGKFSFIDVNQSFYNTNYYKNKTVKRMATATTTNIFI